jgi:hypothetical protein
MVENHRQSSSAEPGVHGRTLINDAAMKIGWRPYRLRLVETVGE